MISDNRDIPQNIQSNNLFQKKIFIKPKLEEFPDDVTEIHLDFIKPVVETQPSRPNRSGEMTSVSNKDLQSNVAVNKQYFRNPNALNVSQQEDKKMQTNSSMEDGGKKSFIQSAEKNCAEIYCKPEVVKKQSMEPERANYYMGDRTPRNPEIKNAKAREFSRKDAELEDNLKKSKENLNAEIDSIFFQSEYSLNGESPERPVQPLLQTSCNNEEPHNTELSNESFIKDKKVPRNGPLESRRDYIKDVSADYIREPKAGVSMISPRREYSSKDIRVEHVNDIQPKFYEEAKANYFKKSQIDYIYEPNIESQADRTYELNEHYFEEQDGNRIKDSNGKFLKDSRGNNVNEIRGDFSKEFGETPNYAPRQHYNEQKYESNPEKYDSKHDFTYNQVRSPPRPVEIFPDDLKELQRYNDSRMPEKIQKGQDLKNQLYHERLQKNKTNTQSQKNNSQGPYPIVYSRQPKPTDKLQNLDHVNSSWGTKAEVYYEPETQDQRRATIVAENQAKENRSYATVEKQVEHERNNTTKDASKGFFGFFNQAAKKNTDDNNINARQLTRRNTDQGQAGTQGYYADKKIEPCDDPKNNNRNNNQINSTFTRSSAATIIKDSRENEEVQRVESKETASRQKNFVATSAEGQQKIYNRAPGDSRLNYEDKGEIFAEPQKRPRGKSMEESRLPYEDKERQQKPYRKPEGEQHLSYEDRFPAEAQKRSNNNSMVEPRKYYETNVLRPVEGRLQSSYRKPEKDQRLLSEGKDQIAIESRQRPNSTLMVESRLPNKDNDQKNAPCIPLNPRKLNEKDKLKEPANQVDYYKKQKTIKKQSKDERDVYLTPTKSLYMLGTNASGETVVGISEAELHQISLSQADLENAQASRSRRLSIAQLILIVLAGLIFLSLISFSVIVYIGLPAL